VFPAEVQFGDAGARAGADRETSDAKNKAFKEAGAYVPTSFDDFDQQIKKAYTKLVKDGRHKPIPDVEPPIIPLDYDVALKKGMIRKPANFISTISDDRGEELRYCGIKISDIFKDKWGLGGVIGLLWFKKDLPMWAREFIERVVLLTADHGPAVSGAHNSIIASRAGKDLNSSLVSGLLTIGPRFGGAVQGSADHFTKYLYADEEPSFMVKDMKSKNVNIQGIGHRIKSVTNPDVRVTIMVDFAKKNFPVTETLDYALEVEKLTTSKRNNLILNVDGCIGVLCCDMLRGIGYTREEVREFVDLGILNAFFVLGRSIGFMGHIMDQKRLKSRLYRHPWDDIEYMMPDKPEKIR
jgi:ATP citrate (pro-S)-lyase